MSTSDSNASPASTSPEDTLSGFCFKTKAPTIYYADSDATLRKVLKGLVNEKGIHRCDHRFVSSLMPLRPRPTLDSGSQPSERSTGAVSVYHEATGLRWRMCPTDDKSVNMVVDFVSELKHGGPYEWHQSLPLSVSIHQAMTQVERASAVRDTMLTLVNNVLSGHQAAQRTRGELGRDERPLDDSDVLDKLYDYVSLSSREHLMSRLKIGRLEVEQGIECEVMYITATSRTQEEALAKLRRLSNLSSKEIYHVEQLNGSREGQSAPFCCRKG